MLILPFVCLMATVPQAPPAPPKAPVSTGKSANTPADQARAYLDSILKDLWERTARMEWPEKEALGAKLVHEIQGRIQAEKDPDVRAILYLGLPEVWRKLSHQMPEELVRPILEGLPATSPEWGRDPNRLRHVIGTVKEAEKAYLTQVAEQHAAPGVRAVAHLLLFKGALRECQTEEARTHLERLGKSAPDSRDFTSSQVEFQDYLTTAPGVMAPGLELPAIDGKGMVKLSSLRGKFVLVDFWATWCAPCCYELPEVHKVWARFKDANFAILSVSCDKKPEIVTAFRRKPDTPMPWHHAFAQTTRNPVCVAWGVKGIPKPVLVGPDGRVIAAGDLLRGPNLLSTLEKHLGKTGPKP